MDEVPADLRAALAAARATVKSIEQTWMGASGRHLRDVEREEPRVETTPGDACGAPHAPWMPFRFVDLLAGIGGFRLALERLGGECAFACDADPMARLAYEGWFGEEPAGDLLEVPLDQIPRHDVLVAALPPEPLPVDASESERLSCPAPRVLGRTNGELFLRLCEVLRLRRPPVVILEAGSHLLELGARVEWEAVYDLLSRSLEYDLHAQVVDEGLYVPQHRHRTFIVGFCRRSQRGDAALFRFPRDPIIRPALRAALEVLPGARYFLDDEECARLGGEMRRWAMGADETAPVIIDPDREPTRQAPELRRSLRPEGLAVFLRQGPRGTPRRLAPIETARLAGFERRVTLRGDGRPTDDVAARLLANATVPAVAQAIAREALRIRQRMRYTADDRDTIAWNEKQWYAAQRLRSQRVTPGIAGGRSGSPRPRTSRRRAS